MPLFSRRKPNPELLVKLVQIARLKANVPLLYAARTSGPGKLWVQHNIDPRQPGGEFFAQIVAIAAGEDETVPSIIFSGDVDVYVRLYKYESVGVHMNYESCVQIRKYKPGDWEKLVDATLESAKEQYRTFYKNRDWAKHKSIPTDEEVEGGLSLVMEMGLFPTEALLPNTLEEVQKEQVIMALSIEKAEREGAAGNAPKKLWEKRLRDLQEHARSLTAADDEDEIPQ